MVRREQHQKQLAARAYLSVALGGSLGAIGRYLISLVVEGVPGTFIANVVGAFLLGLFATLAGEKMSLSPNVRRFVSAGVLGSLTTFSTWSHQTLVLLDDGAIPRAALNSIGSLVTGLGAVALGVWLARKHRAPKSTV